MSKKLFFLTVFLFSLSFSVIAQETDPEIFRNNLISTYGFCKGQELSLRSISTKFPNLQAQRLKAQAEFSVTFGKSCQHIESLLSDEVKLLLNEKLQQLYDESKLTSDLANTFIITVQERAKGNINSPWKETLLSFNPDFEENPALEFVRGFTKKYRTTNHPKAKGLDVEISVPASWKSREGNRPNIVQFFKSQNGYGDETLALQIRELTLPKGLKITQKDIDEMFSPKGLKDFAEGATIIESKSITLEGQKGGMLLYDATVERLDIKLKVRTLSYVILYKNRFIFLQFAVGDTENKMSNTIKEFNKYKPLFQLIGNSLILMDKYK